MSSMPTTGHVIRRDCSLVIISVVVGLSGCDRSPSGEFRVIDQKAANLSPSEESVFGPDLTTAEIETPTVALNVANETMMSIPAEVSPRFPVPASALAIANERQVELIVRNKNFFKDLMTGALRLTFDDVNLLTVLNMEPVTDDAVSWMPEWLTSLEGKSIRVRGFMYPTFQAEDLEVFVLLRDNQECCFGPGAKIYDHILVKMKPGTTANYVPIQRSLDVVGQFKIDLQSANGSVYGLYVIEDAAVIVR